MLCQLFKKSRSHLTLLQRIYMLSLMNEKLMLLLRKTWKKRQHYGPSVKCDGKVERTHCIPLRRHIELWSMR